MGCGASKGSPAGNAPTPLPIPQAPAAAEFDPESKPRQDERYGTVQDRSLGSREGSKRVEDTARTGASDFGDGRQEKSVPAASLGVAAAPVLPSPPKTPPQPAVVASPPLSKDGSRNAGQGAEVPKKPAAPAAVDEAAADAAAYFPVQVSLNVGGPGGAGGVGASSFPPQPLPPQPPPQQLPAASSLGGDPGVRPAALSEATSLQPFVASEPPSLAASTTALPVAPSARHPPPKAVQEEEALPFAVHSQSHLQQQLPPPPQPPPLQPSPPAPPHQQQQQLEEQGSGPGPELLPPPPASDDPWSSLQSQYRIREHAAAEEPEQAVGAVSVRSRAGGTAPDGGKEVLVLGDDDEFSGTKNQLMTSLRSTARGPAALPPAVPPGAQAKKGGWGSGQMAQAGELMMGGMDDDWLEKDRPPGTSPMAAQAAPQHKGSYGSNAGRGGAAQEEEGDPSDPYSRLLKAPLAKGRPADDVQCEDIEDVDALLEDEMDVGRSGSPGGRD